MRLASWALLASGCAQPIVDRGPEIFVDACATGTEQCDLDFGTRDVSVKIEADIAVQSVTWRPLTVLDVSLVGDPAFRLERIVGEVGPQSSDRITVSVRPNVTATIESTLFIVSDAVNGSQGEDGASVVAISIRVTGVDNGIPDIDVIAQGCDFGEVALGTTATCSLAIVNAGNADLAIDEAEIVDCASPCGFRAPLVAGPIPAGAIVSSGIEFAPTAVGAHSARLRIVSSDPDEAQVEVTLSGIGN